MTHRKGTSGFRDSEGGGDDRSGKPVRNRQSQDSARGGVTRSGLTDQRPTSLGGSESAAISSRSVTVETDIVSATLVGIPMVDIRKLAYDHQIDHARIESGRTAQPVALFDLHNVGSVPIKWTSSRTRFVGEDGYTYKPAQISIDPGQLGPGIHTRRVEVQPDRRARVATLVEQLPSGVKIAEVVQQVPTRGSRSGTEKLVFRIGQ